VFQVGLSWSTVFGKRDAFRVGEQAGLPLHRFSLEDAPAAHAAVESGAVGKVLITVGSG